MTQAEPDIDQSLVLAEGNVRQALAQLRRLAHGVFPTALAEEGLNVSLEDLAAGSDVLATLDVQVESVLAAETSMAAYAVFATVLASVEPPAAVTVRVRNRSDILRLRLHISRSPIVGLPGLLADVEDRVGPLAAP